MTDRITLTAAEVAFVLAAADPESRTAAATLLGIPEEERTDAVRAAGLASLTARGLIVAVEGELKLAAPVAAVAEGLSGATTIVQLGLVAVDPEYADGTMIFDTGGVRFLIAPRIHRCFDVTGLDRSCGIPEQVLHLVRSFFAQYRPGVASVRLEHGSDPAVVGHHLVTPAVDPAPGFGWVTVAVGSDGTWTHADVSDQTARVGDEATALARLTTALGELLARPAAATAD